jgi:hypothetical protein
MQRTHHDYSCETTNLIIPECINYLIVPKLAITNNDFITGHATVIYFGTTKSYQGVPPLFLGDLALHFRFILSQNDGNRALNLIMQHCLLVDLGH